jgi:hypothetical protein
LEKLLDNEMYTIVDKNNADACAWGSYAPHKPVEMIYYKFETLGNEQIRIAVEWAGMC